MWKSLELLFGMGDLIWGKDKSEEVVEETPEQTPKEEEFYLSEVKPMKFNYRPQFLSEYIGQEQAKDLVRLNLEKINTIKFVHFLISGAKGTGKSTLANIIANELGLPITWHVGSAFTKEALTEFLAKSDGGDTTRILFIDEIHGLKKELGEFMYLLIEDFIYPGEGFEVRPFIFIGATTEKNILIKNLAPLVDRCGCDIILEQYEAKDIKEILKQYNEKVYHLTISEEIYDILSVNTRYTPRIALALFDDYVVTKDIKRVLSAHRIIKDSLTTIDIKILRHLTEVGKPVGIEALAMIAGVTREDYNYILEPFLIYNDFLTRTSRGRLITNKGKELLQELT